MNKLILIAAFLCASVAFGANKSDSVSAAKLARTNFVAAHGASFVGAKALPAELVDDCCRYDRAKGRADWIFALPVLVNHPGEGRIQFIAATFDSGKFVSGALHTFGIQSQKITAEEFAALAKVNPMAAIKSGAGSASRVVALYCENDGAHLFGNVPQRIRRNFYVAPFADKRGKFSCAVERCLGIKKQTYGYEVIFISNDGRGGSLGKTARGREGYTEQIDKDAIMAALRRLRTENGYDDAKVINDRQLVEWLVAGKFKIKAFD